MYINVKIMIVINPTELRANQKKYFDLAETGHAVLWYLWFVF